MDQTKFRALVRRTVAVPFVAALMIAGAALWVAYDLNEAMQWVDHTDQVLGQSRRLLRLLVDMETGVRGYLLTGDDVFLQPYREAAKAIDSEYRALYRLVADDPAQQTRLETLHDSFRHWQDYAEHMIALRRTGGTYTDLKENLAGKGEMDDIRGQIAGFQSVEEHLREERTRTAHSRWHSVAANCIVLGLGVGCGLALFTRRRLQTIAASFEESLTEQKQVEAELRKNKERLGLAIEVAALGEWELDLKDHIASRSLRHDQIFGYQSLLPQWTYEMFLDHVLPQHRAEIDEKFKASLGSGIWDFETRIRRVDGEVRWIWARGRAWFDERGQPTRMFGTVMDITGPKRAEEALGESREWLRVTLASIGDAVMTADIHGRVTFLNPVAGALTGWQPKEAQGQPIQNVFRIINEQTRVAAEDIITRVLQEGHVVELANHTALVTKDGREVPIEDSAAPITDASGNLAGAVLVFHDVTEKRRKEEQLRRLNRTLKALNNSNQALLHATEEPALLEQVCKIVTEDCGHAMVWIGFAEEDEGKSVRPVAYSGFEEGYLETLGITWADTERGRGPTGTAIRSGQPRSCRNMLTDPEFEPWRAEALKRGYASSLVLPLMEGGKVFGAITIYSRQPDAFSEDEVELLLELAADLAYGVSTLRIRAAREQAVRELQRAERELIEAQRLAHVGSWYWDANTDITTGSDEFLRIYGLDSTAQQPAFKEKRGRLYPAGDWERLNAAMQRTLQTGVGYELDVEAIRDGAKIWITTRSEAVRNADGQIVGLRGTVQDLTERKQAEEALLRSEKLASVGRMAASIAHEINNPLAAVMNTIFLAQTNADEPESVRLYLDTADDELKRIAHITRQTLGFYRDSSAPTLVSVHSVLDSAVDLLRGKIRVKGATIEKQYDGDLQVMAVPGELRQIFSNLLANSLDAMGEQGTIKLRVSGSTCVNSNQPRIRITVADDGTGIDAATLPHIFEPLFTTKEATGSGLGLWVSKQLVEKQGGFIRVRSSPNGARRGTVFSIFLPAQQAPRAERAAASSS